jgi:hypothetical protein
MKDPIRVFFQRANAQASLDAPCVLYDISKINYAHTTLLALAKSFHCGGRLPQLVCLFKVT